jgi:hypothetical protein
MSSPLFWRFAGGTVATGFAGIYEAIITDISGLTTGMLVAWVHIDTNRGGIAGTICVECLKRIIDRQRVCDGGGIPAEGKEACYAREPKEPR